MADSNEEVAPTKTPDSPGPGDLERSSRRRLLTTIGAIGVSASLAGSVSADEDDDTGPTIESLEVINSSNPPWMWYYVDWDVSSEAGDLETVRTDLMFDGTIVDSAETPLSDSTASGEHRVRTKGEADTVRFIAVDVEGHLRGRTFEVQSAEDSTDETSTEDGSSDGNMSENVSETAPDADNVTDDGSRADGTPGPGVITTVASIGGAGYLLSRTGSDDE